MNWTFNNIEFDTTMMNNFGFIYKITLSNNQFYIGKKQILNFTIKQIQNYNSSNLFIKKNKQNIVSKEILLFTKNKLQTTYNEVKYQMLHNVLENDLALNDNILGKFYKSKLNK